MTEYIAPLGTVVIICTTHLTLKKICILLTYCTYVLHTIRNM